MLIIKGYDTRYSNKRNAEEYARFGDGERRDACVYLNHLKTSCLGSCCKFWIEERNEIIMRIVMSIKEWEILMKHINENKLEIVKSFEIGKTDENILNVKHLCYLSDNRLYGYNLKESAEKFYNINEISEEKVSFDINIEDLIELL